MTVSGRDRTRTCKGFRLARFPSGCHRACWLALPYQAVPAGLEPAPVWLTASRTTVVLRDSKAKRTEQESNLNEAGARLLQGPMTGAPASDANPVQAVPAAGVEPAASAFSARRSHHLSYTGMSKRRRQESNLLDSRCCSRPPGRPAPAIRTRAGGGTRTHFVRVTRAVPGPSSIAGTLRAASAGVEPTRPRFRASVPCRGPGQRRSRASGGTRTRTRPFTGGVLGLSSCTGVCRTRVDSRLRSGTATVTGSHAEPLHHTHHQSRSSISWVRSSKSRPASSR